MTRCCTGTRHVHSFTSLRLVNDGGSIRTMEEIRSSIQAFSKALEGVAKFKPEQREKWLTYASGMPDEFVEFLTSVTTANPSDMVLLDKNLEQKKIALSTDDVSAWRKIIKWEGDLLGQPA